MAIAEQALEGWLDDRAASRAFVLQLIGDFGITLASLLNRPSWMRDASCAEYPSDVFFPRRGQSAEPAVTICRGCLVKAECQTFALAQGQELKGVWGGLSEQERRRRREAGERVTIGRISGRWEPEHGTITRYRHHGCRCPACKAAKAEERARAG